MVAPARLVTGGYSTNNSSLRVLNKKGLYYAMWRQQIGERKTAIVQTGSEEEEE